tara:strand:+ start:4749 stop:5537 length:789 start_codon:yes stop_codon:yes gene_type:complete
MPIDATIWTDFVSTVTLHAVHIKERFKELQRFVNGGIKSSDMKKSEPWVEAQHIFKPEFYASPSPRFEAVSGDVYHKHRAHNKMNRYYRHEHSGSSIQPGGSYEGAGSNPEVWHPIEGMSSTIHVTEDSVVAMVMGTFYAWESGGVIGGQSHDESADLTSKKGYVAATITGRHCAEFMLWVDTDDGTGPQKMATTQRRIYPRGGGRYNCRKMQHSFAELVTLTRGVNKISYRSWYRQFAEDDKTARHVYVDGRNFIVDVHYK